MRVVVDRFTRSQTCGLFEILDRPSIDKLLRSDQYLSSTEGLDLCLVYLVLAIGMVMAESGHQDRSVSALMTDQQDHADMFFRSGKLVGDVAGFLDGDIRTVQARVLMALYNFLVSDWNAAYDCLGTWFDFSRRIATLAVWLRRLH